MTTWGRYKYTEFSQFVKINLVFLSFRDHDETVAQLNSMSDEQIRQPAVTSGAYDIIAIIPAGDKRYESAENPRFIEALPSVEHRGCSHPRHKE